MNRPNDRFIYGDADAVLIVDDDDRVLKFVSRMLQSFGFDEVLQASSGEAALELWRGKQSRIWLVITDFLMPNMTGDAMAAEMLKDRPALKVLFISGNDPLSLKSTIPLRPGKNFLQKPFTISDMRQTINVLRPFDENN